MKYRIFKRKNMNIKLFKKIFCNHSYEKTDAKPIRTYYDYDGNKVGVFVCMCSKCKNVKKKKFWQ